MLRKVVKNRKVAIIGIYSAILLLLFISYFIAQHSGPVSSSNISNFKFFSFMTDPNFSNVEKIALWLVLATAFAGLFYALFLIFQVLGCEKGTDKMVEVANAIKSGANAYLFRQFKTIAPLILVITVTLYFTADNSIIGFGRALAFLVGSSFSATVGFVGMNLAVQGNVRVAAASRKSFGESLKIAYRTGTITGMLTDGLGLLGGTLIFMAYGEKAYEVLLGFGFGGTLLALFMRVGGGIYTKAADVGADLVGKIEKNIPEDDPRNAATIADNVGDNVGDCAGMAADIFESYEVTIVSAMILGWASFGHIGVIFPLLVRAIGVFSSIIGTYLVKTKEEVRNAMKAINIGFWTSALISIIGFAVVGFFYLRIPQTSHLYSAVSQLPFLMNFGIRGLDMRPVWTTLIGIFLAITINRITEHFTHTANKPVQELARSCQTGHATNIISGIAIGYESTVWAIIVIAVAIFGCVLIYAGTNATFIAYGVAMCGIGMLTLTGNNISMDVFGPVADNANGIGEMAKLDKNARQTLADLDAVGNTTKAITKGIAIASAVIAAVSLFNAFITEIMNITNVKAGKSIATYESIAGLLTIADPKVFIGFLIGGAIPFLFSSLTIRAVGRAAFLIVKEVRQQFKDKDIWEGKKLPDYGRVVSICTLSAQKELVGPGLLAVLTPVVVGLLLHKEALAGYLAGMILTGQLLAVFMANAGGAWDNAKKMIEDGIYGGKGSEAHKASVTGDTVGDPLKDTAGPALNPLIKVMNMVAMLIIPFVLESQKMTLSYLLVSFAFLVVIMWAIWNSKRESKEIKQVYATFETQDVPVTQ